MHECSSYPPRRCRFELQTVVRFVPFAVVAGLFVPAAAVALPINSVPLEMQQYLQQQTGAGGLPTSATGEIAGSASIAAASLSDGDYFDLAVTKDFAGSGENGLRETLDFNVSGGAVNYSFDVDYSLTFEFPSEVRPGDRVYLNPTVSWGDAWLQATQDLSFSTVNDVWINAPYDGLPALEVGLNQYPDRLDVSGSFPTGPLLPAVSVDFTLDAGSPYPLNAFGDGEASLLGVTNKLGGTGSIASAGGYTGVVGDQSLSFGTATGVFDDAWYTSGDQLTFMTGIPYAGVAALALNLAGFDLDHAFDIDIARSDSIFIELTSLPYVDIPLDVAPGSHYVFDVVVPLDFRARTQAYFQYFIDTSVIFDGPGFGAQTLLDVDIGSIEVGLLSSEWIQGTSQFRVAGAVPVVAGPSRFLDPDFGALLPAPFDPGPRPPNQGYTPLDPSDTVNAITVPEPSSSWLFGAGLVCLMAWRIRRPVRGMSRVRF